MQAVILGIERSFFLFIPMLYNKKKPLFYLSEASKFVIIFCINNAHPVLHGTLPANHEIPPQELSAVFPADRNVP